jgi:prolyl-tRNA synthetase
MQLSKLFTKTSKNISADEVSANAQYLLRGGFINRTIAGVYSYLPLGLRVLNKIEQIIRKHMDTVSQEVMMPVLQPIASRELSGRLDKVDVLMKSTGANEKSKTKSTNEYILWCTHEEVVTPLVQEYAKSYKDLPVSVYQIQSKFRNEARAKSGLLRGREFRMKDAYSFHRDETDLLHHYEEMKQVYMNIFEDLGIGQDTYYVAASGGDFTDKFSHEFQTRLDTGEDEIFLDNQTWVCYNSEVAPSQAPAMVQDSDYKSYEEIIWEGVIGVEDLAKFLGVTPEQTTKTIIFQTNDGRVIAAAVRGDYEINELKLQKVAGCKSLELASAKLITQLTGAIVGYAWIVNLPESIELYCDDSIQSRTNFECGCNKSNYHAINVNRDRDVKKPEQFYDFKLAKQGDICPESGQVYEVFPACEVGNIFPLNTKFSEAFGYNYTDNDNQKKIVYMGCYGIGPSRVMGVIVEKYHDEKGIIRPENIAPYKYILIPIKATNLDQAMGYYKLLQSQWVEVCIDDRDISPGMKFGDADLIGYPYQIIISDKVNEQGKWLIELVNRKSGHKEIIDITLITQ